MQKDTISILIKRLNIVCIISNYAQKLQETVLDMRKNLICICKGISFWSKCAKTLPHKRNFSKTLYQIREQTHRFYQFFSYFFSCCNSIFWYFAPFEFASTLAVALILFWYPIWLLRVAIVKLESRRLHYYLFQVIFLS